MMDLSDLPQSAQDRIAASEIEAESILKRSKIPGKVARIRAGSLLAKPENWPDGPIRGQKRFEQDLFEAAALDSLHQGRIGATRHVLGAVAGEYIRDGNLDTEQFDAKLEAIGDWVCKKFRVKRAWFDAEKQGWRVMALRTRAGEGGFPKPDRAGAIESNESSRTDAVSAGSGINGHGARPNPEFPARASWLAARLHERSWNKHDVARNNGPHHKTVQKVLDGRHVREDALLKLAGALSAAPAKLKLAPVSLADIPID